MAEDPRMPRIMALVERKLRQKAYADAVQYGAARPRPFYVWSTPEAVICLWHRRNWDYDVNVTFIDAPQRQY